MVLNPQHFKETKQNKKNEREKEMYVYEGQREREISKEEQLYLHLTF